jgi:hypothetical protein
MSEKHPTIFPTRKQEDVARRWVYIMTAVLVFIYLLKHLL